MKTIQPGFKIYAASRVDLDISTRDTTTDGYLKNDGTNRSLYAAISSEGELSLIMATNGDDMMLCEYDLDFFRDVGSNGDIAEGIANVRDAAKIMRKIFWMK